MKIPDYIRFPFVLVIVAGVSAAVLAGLYTVTLPAKERIQAEITTAARSVVMPQAATFEPKEAEVDGKRFSYSIAKSDAGELLGYIANGEADGYSSRIRVMVGTTPELEIGAIKVLYQKETPGLGDKVEEVLSKKTWWTVITGTSPDESKVRPWFQVQFDGQKPPIKLKSHGGAIDAITGATISSKAVCAAVNQAVDRLRAALADEQGASGETG